MAGRIDTQSVETAVSEYIAQRHPHVLCLEVSMLKLDETWLVQATVEALDGTAPSTRLVLLVNDGGVVDEVGGSVSRQSAQRCLAGLKAVGGAEVAR